MGTNSTTEKTLGAVKSIGMKHNYFLDLGFYIAIKRYQNSGRSWETDFRGRTGKVSDDLVLKLANPQKTMETCHKNMGTILKGWDSLTSKIKNGF